MRREMKKKWRDEMHDKKQNWETRWETGKNGEMGRKMKKNGR